MSDKKKQKICDNGHTFYKSSDCPVCPKCEAQDKPTNTFLSIIGAPARRALEREDIISLVKLSNYTENALFRAAFAGQIELVTLLIEAGAYVSQRSETGWTALMNAAAEDHLAIVQLLHAHGASLDDQTQEGEPALFRAAENGQVMTLRWLLEAGCNPRHTNVRGETALMLAALAGHLTCVQCLLDHGADLNQRNQDGQTARDYANLSPNAEGMAMMIDTISACGKSAPQ